MFDDVKIKNRLDIETYFNDIDRYDLKVVFTFLEGIDSICVKNDNMRFVI